MGEASQVAESKAHSGLPRAAGCDNVSHATRPAVTVWCLLLYAVQGKIKESVASETIEHPAVDPSEQRQTGPAQEYTRRLQLREGESRGLHGRHIWTGNARVVVFAAIFVLFWTIGKSGKPSPAWLIAAILSFIALVVWHRRILRAKEFADRAINFYKRGLARLEDRWSGTGDTGEQFNRPDHLYAEDLDILGQGSLFQLLCTARSRMGKACLADWLLTQAEPAQVQDRQMAVAELREKLNLREQLALAGNQEQIDADPTKLKQWSETRVDLNYRRWWPLVIALNVVTLATLAYVIAGYVVHGNGFWTPFVAMLIINRVVLQIVKKRLQALFSGLDEASRNLASLAAILRVLEDERFTAPRLQALRQKLFSNGVRASASIARLGTLCDFEESRHNMMVLPLEFIVLYSLHVALALQRWRERYAGNIVEWVDSVGDFEALGSLATYAFEHPEDRFPSISSNTQNPGFLAARGLGHPLLPGRDCVRNDVSLGPQGQVLLVSGSNMSGKSTLLRAVGINAVLALMGAPVRAEEFSISPVTLGSSMRISDSLQRGVSHFYAEIRRIRQVVDISRRGPLLFLFDEILQGTNSHDRRIGAEGILRTLLQNGAIGLVTTHDLVLTSLEQLFPQQIANVHFQEKLESGALSFDYRLRPGVVTTSNGLELMKSVGLDV